MSYNGVGLNTPRGSGTSGHVQTNLAAIKPKGNYEFNVERILPPEEKQPNTEILDHQRKRQIEVQVMEWADKTGLLDQENLSEEAKQLMLQKKRDELSNSNIKSKKIEGSHQKTQKKKEQTVIFKKALKIRDDYVTGSAFDQELQNKLKEERIQQRIEKELEKERLKELEDRKIAEQEQEKEQGQIEEKHKKNDSQEKSRKSRDESPKRNSEKNKSSSSSSSHKEEKKRKRKDSDSE